MNTNLPHLVFDQMKVQQLSEIILPECIQPYEDAAALIWSQFDEETEKKLIELICNKKVSLDFVLKAIYRASTKNPKQVNFLSDLYSKISTRFDSPIIWTPPLVPPECRTKEIYEDDPLFNLVAYDRFEELIEYISKYPIDINQTNNDLSLIECACKYGSSNVFRYLLVNGGKVDEILPKYAVEGGSTEIISLLKQNDCNFGDCIRIAVINHHNDIADWIISHYDFNALTVAECLMWCNFTAAIFFLENGFDVNQIFWSRYKTFNETNPLMCAVDLCSIELVKYLIDHGGDVNFTFVLLIIYGKFVEILFKTHYPVQFCLSWSSFLLVHYVHFYKLIGFNFIL